MSPAPLILQIDSSKKSDPNVYYGHELEILRQRIDRVWIDAIANTKTKSPKALHRLSGMTSTGHETNMNMYRLDQLRLELGITNGGNWPQEGKSLFVHTNSNDAIIAKLSNYHLIQAPMQANQINPAFLQQLAYELGTYNDVIKILQGQPQPDGFNLTAIPNFSTSNFPHTQIAQHVSLAQFVQNIENITQDPALQAQLIKGQANYHSAQPISSATASTAEASIANADQALPFATALGQKLPTITDAKTATFS